MLVRDACVEGTGVLVFVERNVHTWSFCDMGADPGTVYALSAKAVSDFPRSTLGNCCVVDAVDAIDTVDAVDAAVRQHMSEDQYWNTKTCRKAAGVRQHVSEVQLQYNNM